MNKLRVPKRCLGSTIGDANKSDADGSSRKRICATTICDVPYRHDQEEHDFESGEPCLSSWSEYLAQKRFLFSQLTENTLALKMCTMRNMRSWSSHPYLKEKLLGSTESLTSLMPNYYDCYDDRKNDIQSTTRTAVSNQTVVPSFEVWPSLVPDEALLGVTVNWIDQSWAHQSRFLVLRLIAGRYLRHTGTVFSSYKALSGVLQYNITFPRLLLEDWSAFQTPLFEIPPENDLRCFASTLRLVVYDAVRQIPLLAALIDKVYNCSGKLLATSALDLAQRQRGFLTVRKPKLTYPGQGGSIFEMCQRFLELMTAILVAEKSMSSSEYVALDQSEWSLLVHLSNLLGHFHDASDIAALTAGDIPTLAVSVIGINYLSWQCSQPEPMPSDLLSEHKDAMDLLRAKLLGQLNQRRPAESYDKLTLLSMLLDVRTKASERLTDSQYDTSAAYLLKLMRNTIYEKKHLHQEPQCAQHHLFLTADRLAKSELFNRLPAELQEVDAAASEWHMFLRMTHDLRAHHLARWWSIHEYMFPRIHSGLKNGCTKRVLDVLDSY